MRRIKLGTRIVDYPSDDLKQLEDSNHLLDNVEALKAELQSKGYIYIKGLHDRQEVLDARLAVLDYIRNLGEGKLKEGTAWEQGVLDERCGFGCVPYMEGRNDVTHSEAVSKVIEGHRPFEFFKKLFGEDAKTFDFKWLRGIHREAFSGAHVDNVYMSRGTDQLYTMWTPLGDVDIEMGTLAMCEGSNHLPGYSHFQDTYGNCDIENIGLEGTGWFTTDPFEISKQFGGQWKTTDFKAGDAIIFTMRTVHMSSVNSTEKLRISCDTRWQPASQSADPRYVGNEFHLKGAFGLAGIDEGRNKKNVPTIDILKKQWGFPLAMA
ncbi:unnamed protein product [Owenia fusiformis]|uniref:Uncharacterized protein n=1 Tax=Owenia fusiformis TaxID=6347 RepID=A0A8J1TDT5_OWEFU|nr:unnamed protein product [Owenia fusiformis]